MPQATDSGLDESLYEDESVTEESGDETETETETVEETESVDSVDEEIAKKPTVMVPTASLGKLKEGDSGRFTIVKRYGEESELKISPDSKEEEPVVVEEADELSELERM